LSTVKGRHQEGHNSDNENENEGYDSTHLAVAAMRATAVLLTAFPAEEASSVLLFISNSLFISAMVCLARAVELDGAASPPLSHRQVNIEDEQHIY
jgi:hypothetical protein